MSIRSINQQLFKMLDKLASTKLQENSGSIVRHQCYVCVKNVVDKHFLTSGSCFTDVLIDLLCKKV